MCVQSLFTCNLPSVACLLQSKSAADEDAASAESCDGNNSSVSGDEGDVSKSSVATRRCTRRNASSKFRLVLESEC